MIATLRQRAERRQAAGPQKAPRRAATAATSAESVETGLRVRPLFTEFRRRVASGVDGTALERLEQANLAMARTGSGSSSRDLRRTELVVQSGSG